LNNKIPKTKNEASSHHKHDGLKASLLSKSECAVAFVVLS